MNRKHVDMNARQFKDQVYNELSAISKAMANPHRLEILELLAQGPSTVEYIADHTGLSIANTSHHLQVLRKARLAKTERKGKYSHYSLANMQVFEVWNSLRELGLSQNAEIERLIRDFRNDRQSLETISLEVLQQRIENKEVLLLDVRPEEEFEEGHITSAVSIPAKKLEERIKSLPTNKEIIAYCRGPLCAMADEAVEILRNNGFRSKRLEGGYPEWLMKNLAKGTENKDNSAN